MLGTQVEGRASSPGRETAGGLRTPVAPQKPELLIPLSTIPRYKVHNRDMTIGELAAKAAVNIQTVRFYERRGILPEPPRSGSGYRCYDKSDLETLCLSGGRRSWALLCRRYLNCFPRIEPSQDCHLL